jgi:hypothetical protein
LEYINNYLKGAPFPTCPQQSDPKNWGARPENICRKGEVGKEKPRLDNPGFSFEDKGQWREKFRLKSSPPPFLKGGMGGFSAPAL